jgi:ABC-2 type transport system ATP-binding protein
MGDLMDWSVEVDKLTVRFGSFTAVDDVSFRVNKGEIFGFLGANGAGKTTTIRALCGLITPDSGTARVAGAAVGGDSMEVKKRVGYMSQRFTLWMDLSVEENLAFAASLRRIPKPELLRRREELAGLIGFDGHWEHLVGELPGGVRQQVSLMAALLHDPEVVFLDEPTAGVAPMARKRFWDLIRKVAGLGKTVFVTTHYMDEAENCGRIALMRDGRVIALDTPQGLKDHAFPHGLVEVEPEGQDQGWMEGLEAVGLPRPRPHGRRWHLEASNPAAWEHHAAAFPGLAWHRTQPSLEDVFLKLVEGHA